MLITKDSCDKNELKLFYKKCKSLGYRFELKDTQNKWEKFFYTYKGDNIISVSGCYEYSFLQMYGDKLEKTRYVDGMRICYLGMQLPNEDTYKVLSKYHMNSIPFREHIPLQIEWGNNIGYDRFFITTHNWYGTPANLYKGPHRKWNRTNAAMKHMRKLNIVNEQSQNYVDGYWQTVWELNQYEYFRVQTLTRHKK